MRKDVVTLLKIIVTLLKIRDKISNVTILEGIYKFRWVF